MACREPFSQNLGEIEFNGHIRGDYALEDNVQVLSCFDESLVLYDVRMLADVRTLATERESSVHLDSLVNRFPTVVLVSRRSAREY